MGVAVRLPNDVSNRDDRSTSVRRRVSVRTRLRSASLLRSIHENNFAWAQNATERWYSAGVASILICWQVFKSESPMPLPEKSVEYKVLRSSAGRDKTRQLCCLLRLYSPLEKNLNPVKGLLNGLLCLFVDPCVFALCVQLDAVGPRWHGLIQNKLIEVSLAVSKMSCISIDAGEGRKESARDVCSRR